MRTAGSRRIVLAFACLAAALVAVVLLGRPSGAGAAGNPGELTVQPSLGSPAITFLGAAEQEAPGEAWATTRNRSLTRYTSAGGWEIAPTPLSATGTPIAEGNFVDGASAGRTTPNGGVAVAMTRSTEKLLFLRDPGGTLREAPEPGPLHAPGEELFEEAPLLAVDEASGHARAYVVPSGRHTVLDYDGEEWSQEEICLAGVPAPGCSLPPSGFRALAIEAGGGEAWLLGRNAAPGEGVELFRREASGGPGGTPVWRQQALGGALGARYAEANPLGVALSARANGQLLTVSEKGVWVDVVLNSGGESFEATIFYDIAAGMVTGSWCDLANPELCKFPLGAELPSGEGRSFAWPDGGEFGERVITGVGQGAVLSLQGTTFSRTPLGGGNAGARLGAALSAPDQGWLGAKPPLQLTYAPEPAHLEQWPVPFRRPLLAIAPAPGTPVAALGSEALAVGDNGQVARYVPSQGWEPEPLLRSSGKRATPTLRGVAWPVPSRAYAVGDNAAM
ncbi:MAG TPA: hypothetical protein VG816_14920, partial [Solirubrobacterales bacterium]|nr:hypothetical protein [Solirubrobacterales bacterium]